VQSRKYTSRLTQYCIAELSFAKRYDGDREDNGIAKRYDGDREDNGIAKRYDGDREDN
jgi:hypothetical protein